MCSARALGEMVPRGGQNRRERFRIATDRPKAERINELDQCVAEPEMECDKKCATYSSKMHQ